MSTNILTQLANYLRNNWGRIYFATSVLLIVFAYGMAAGIYGLFPYNVLKDGVTAAQDWVANSKQYARIRPDKHLRKARREGKEVARYAQAEVWDGVTLMAGMWGEQLGFKLVDMQGNLLHEWPVSFNATWPEATHLKTQPHDWDTAIHGMVAFPNGDIVFNYEHNGLVRIDRCAAVMWKIAEETHHDIFVDDDGTLWVPNNVLRTEADKKFPLLSAPFWEDSIIQVSPDGEILRRISLLNVMHKSGYEGMLVDPNDVIAGKNWTGTVSSKRKDITHLNNIDILTADLASAFPQFNAGDILLSLRNLDQLIVVDRETETIKWSNVGPWLMQHDPDFQPDGSILVYDNRARRWSMDGTNSGSQIVRIDPQTRATEVIYTGSAEDIFYASQMGKQQMLPNGNLLITEPEAGRVFEVNEKGATVWEYINRWGDDEVAFVTDGLRLPGNYFDIAEGQCQ